MILISKFKSERNLFLCFKTFSLFIHVFFFLFDNFVQYFTEGSSIPEM